jgi:hypothetical protein
MLSRILAAATEPTPEESNFGVAIARFGAALVRHGETQTAIRWEISRLREDVLAAITGEPQARS